MLPDDHPDRIHIAFDDHRLVNNAGLILPATLALHLGLPQLVDRHLDLGDAPGRANMGDKIMTLVASAPRFRGGRVSIFMVIRPAIFTDIQPPWERGELTIIRL